MNMPRPLWIALCCCALWLGNAQAQPQQSAAPLERDGAADPSEARRSAQDKHIEAMYAQYGTRVVQALLASGQPRALALAAMLAAEHNTLREHSATWWQAAVQNAGRDGMVYRMVLMFMQPPGPQDEDGNRLRETAARRWLALDAGNLAPLLHMEQSAQQLLAQATAASHNDEREFETLRWIYASLRQYPPTAQEAKVLQQTWDEGRLPSAQWKDMAMLTTISLTAAANTPRYGQLHTACKKDALEAEPARRAACHRAALVLGSRSTSSIATLLGLRLQMDLATSAHECQAIKAKSLPPRWLLHQWGQWLRQPGHGSLMDYAKRTLTDPTVRSEQDVMQTLLRAHGMELVPPPGWNGARPNDPC